ncbi:MAG: DNA methyltransferase [Nitrospinales bacterium]
MRAPQVRQRSDYTFKHNASAGRFGWLRLTPAYSVKIVDQILEKRPGGTRVLDPFAGTSTTALYATYRGHEATTVEINPFLVWFGRTKTDRYSESIVKVARNQSAIVLKATRTNRTNSAPAPPIHNIDRWWNSPVLSFLRQLKGALDELLPGTSPSKALLLVAFCRTMITLSNAAFNHQSMSFKDISQVDLFKDLDLTSHYESIYTDNLEFVLASATHNPNRKSTIIQGDARALQSVVRGKFDMVITSPPYPNRMSYIRELRPYMYWLGYLREAREAGELDWQAIGGTWGIATSRLMDWERNKEGFYPNCFKKILDRIAHVDNKNGELLSKYVAKYFEDIWSHLNSMLPVLSRGSRVHYIVGNSTFYDILLPTEHLYADMLAELGFSNIQVKTVRKRNSKKELFEFEVSGAYGV